MRVNDEKTITTDAELEKIADIYRKMDEPNRNLLVMSFSLLLASQNANQEVSQSQPLKTG